MRLIPALDLMGGLVVRGLGGRRAEYRPWVSPLCGSADPMVVGRALVARAGARELYVADLEALSGAPPASDLYRRLREFGVDLWVDSGITDLSDAEPLDAAGVSGLIAGLETIAAPASLSRLVDRFGPERVIFSLDLRGGRAVAAAGWGGNDARELAAQAVAVGVRRLIVLDLQRVGSGSGTGSEELCRWLGLSFPELEIIAGGGVRDRNDLHRLAACGVAAALVATALHDGRL